MSDLRSFLEKLRKIGKLKEITKELSPKFEIAKVMKILDNGPAILFKKVKNSEIPVVSGIAGSRELFMEALNTNSYLELYKILANSISEANSPKQVNEAPFMKNSFKDDLTKLPILTHFEKDKGPYFTSGIVYTVNPDTGIQNASIHRLLVLDKNHLAIRIVPRHLYSIYHSLRKKNKPLNIAIVVGVNPIVELSASAPVPINFDEMYVANTLLNNKLTVCPTPHFNILVPAHAEIVIEAQILPEDVEEGPFVDITGTYDEVRRQPKIEVKEIFYRDNPFYRALLPSGAEHKLLMGLYREVKIYEHVKNVVPHVRGVNLTLGGAGWLHAVVSATKQTEGDGKNIIFAAFSGHPSVKHVVVVDEDIDPYNMEEVEWAIATRLRGEKGVVIIPDARGSSLDPSGDQESGLTTKIGIDATRTFSKPREGFEKAKIPADVDIDKLN
ncbi:MAG: UbiD family decarboxylase [Candidatus Odinarchaeia archaeon]